MAGLLFMSWKGGGDDGDLYWSSFDGSKWARQQKVLAAGKDGDLDRYPSASSHGPALVTFRGQLLLAWKGFSDDNGIYWSTFDGTFPWSPQQLVDGVGTSTGPGLATNAPGCTPGGADR